MDEANKQIIHDWLHHLNAERGVTTIMITHDAGEIAEATQLMCGVDGRLGVGK